MCNKPEYIALPLEDEEFSRHNQASLSSLGTPTSRTIESGKTSSEQNLMTGDFVDGRRHHWKRNISGEYESNIPARRIRAEKRQERRNAELLLAVFNGDMKEVERCLHHGGDCNARCLYTRTRPVHVAALKGHSTILRFLIEKGADPKATDIHGRSLLHFAAWNGNEKCLKTVLSYDSDVSRKSVAENTERVHKEWKDAWWYRLQVVEQMLPHLPLGSTPLHVASQRANVKCCQLLLQAGADMNSTDKDDLNPFDVVGEKLTTNSQQSDSLAEVISELVKAGARPTVNSYQGVLYRTSPVHQAVIHSSLDSIKLLREADVDPAVYDAEGATPVHLCVHRKLLEPLKTILQEYLVGECSLVDVEDLKGCTSLHYAVEYEWLEGVSILLEAGADISVRRREDDATPLLVASRKGNTEILQEMLGTGDIDKSILDMKDIEGSTALMEAVKSEDVDSVELLLRHGSDASVKLRDGTSAIHWAAEHDEISILNDLLEICDESSLNDTNFHGMTALHLAAKSGHLECVKALLNRKCDRTLKTGIVDTGTKTTALHLGAENGHPEIVKALLDGMRSIVDEVDSRGRTPLHTCCQKLQEDCARVLISAGADLAAETEDDEGATRTAMDFIMHNFTKPVDFLQDVFDSGISVNEYPLNDTRCEVSVSYSVLVPHGNKNGQMSVMEAFLKTGNSFKQHNLLLHPLIMSFIYLKWRKLKPMFYIILACFAIYVFSLTLLSMFLYYWPDPPSFVIILLRVLVLISLVFYFSQEFFHAWRFRRIYMTDAESWLKLTCLITSLIVVFVSRVQDYDFRRDFAGIAVLCAWMEFSFLLSRFPDGGYYILVFFKVATNVFKVFLTFTFLFIGFTLGFLIQFHGLPPFSGIWESSIKVLVMMMNEFEYEEMFKDSSSLLYPDVLKRIVFLIFLFLVSIALMNLMVGLAVSDISVLQAKGRIGRLHKQVDFLRMLEAVLYKDTLISWLPKSVAGMVRRRREVRTKQSFFPSKKTRRFGFKYLPSYILDSFLEVIVKNRKNGEQHSIEDVYQKVCEIASRDPIDNALRQGNIETPKNVENEIDSIRQQLTEMSVESYLQGQKLIKDLKALKEDVERLSNSINLLYQILNKEDKVD